MNFRPAKSVEFEKIQPLGQAQSGEKTFQANSGRIHLLVFALRKITGLDVGKIDVGRPFVGVTSSTPSIRSRGKAARADAQAEIRITVPVDEVVSRFTTRVR